MENGRPKGAKKKRRKRSPRQCANELKAVLRQEKACQLRVEGYSIRDIAKKLGCAPMTVHADIAAVLERSRDSAHDAVEREKRLSLRRLDQAVRGIWPKVKAGEEPATQTLIRIEQRRAKVEGFDAADKHEFSGPGGKPIEVSTRVSLSAKLDDLRKRLSGNAGEPGGNAGAPTGSSG